MKMLNDKNRGYTFYFSTLEESFEFREGLLRMCKSALDDFVSVYDINETLELPNNLVMKQIGWNIDTIRFIHVRKDETGFIISLPPARPVEELKSNKEMNKPTMDLKNSLYTSTSTATVNWQDNTFTLTNPAITIEQSANCPGSITISGDTIGVSDWAVRNTDYTSFFRDTRDYCEDNIKKMEDKMNTVAKRNGKSIVEATNFKKIEVYNDRVVKITFADGTYTKAVCSDKDVFCLDTGIMVCVMKKLFGGQKEGTKHIALMLDDAHTQMEKQINDKIEAENKRIAEKQKKRKAELKKAAKKMKAKEEAIDIQKQAYIRAMQEMGMTKDE